MLHIIIAAVLAAAPAPTAPAAHKDHAQHHGMDHGKMKHEGPCCPKDSKPMDCCKDKPMPCCEKKAEAVQPAEAGAHNHAH